MKEIEEARKKKKQRKTRRRTLFHIQSVLCNNTRVLMRVLLEKKPSITCSIFIFLYWRKKEEDTKNGIQRIVTRSRGKKGKRVEDL